MSNRITQKDLEAIVKRINIITNSPLEPYTRDAVEAFTALSVLCPNLELELTQFEYSGDCIFNKKLMSTNN